MTLASTAVLLAGAAGAMWGGSRIPASRRLGPHPVAPARLVGWRPAPWLERRAPVLAVGAVAGLALLGHGLLATLALAASVVLLAPARRRAGANARKAADLARDLPRAADLLATCLEAGAAPADALRVVAELVGGQVQAVLGPVATALRLGVDPGLAWSAAARTGGPLAALGRAYVRASSSGAPLAATVAAVAAEERERARWESEAAARRAGVRAVGPLAVCFLPAFLLLGVVPVVAAVARDVVGGLR